MRDRWLNKNILLLSLSAFFADFGYQAVLILFPIYLVFILHLPVYIYGIITALSFGIGSLFSYLGGLLGDKFNKKYIVILGNSLIPLMSLSVIFHSIWIISILYIIAWWARYFRTPARRTLVSESSKSKYRSKVFGFLHALDILGGVFAISFSVLFIFLGIGIKDIIIISIIPILISTILLFFIDNKNKVEEVIEKKENINVNIDKIILISLFIATLFYGFSSFNLGFPILTIVSVGNTYILAILAYGIYLLVSAFSGYILGSLKISPMKAIWSLGYLTSAIGALFIGCIYLLDLNFIFYYIAIIILGIGMGAIETYEPTLVSLIPSDKKSTNMGYLSMFRSIGLFISNLVIGFLFVINQSDAYFYAFLSALIASLIIFRVSRKYQ
ncbi:MFS transporter [Patescibacteria group bacterium]|nr:MFS transporter [Patescibacteria group bacterium]